MAIIHDKYVIELKEVIKGYGNDPQVKDPLRFPCDYKFYEIDGVAICEESFKKMKLLEDIAIPKDQYEARLKADLEAILKEISTAIEEEREDCQKHSNCYERFAINAMAQRSQIIIKQKIDVLKGVEDDDR